MFTVDPLTIVYCTAGTRATTRGTSTIRAGGTTPHPTTSPDNRIQETQTNILTNYY